MTTYNVRADGTQATALSATGLITDISKCMTFSTFTTAMNASAFADGDTITLSSRGGNLIASAILSIATDNITIKSETGYRARIDASGGAYSIKVRSCSNSLLEDFEVFDTNGANAVEWIETGTGHVIRNVHAHGATGAASAAFSNELTDAGATVTGYDLTGNNCADDGWSSHGGGNGGSITYLYGGNFYGNKQNINIQQDAIIEFHDVKTFGGSDFDFGTLGAGVSVTANFYDCEFGGAVIACDTLGTTFTGNFYRCKFHCNAVSVVSGFTTACIRFNKNAGKGTSYVYMESCEFGTPPAGTHVMVIYESASTFEAIKCEVNQKTIVGNGFWFANPISWIITDCNFYQCAIGISGNSAGNLTKCNFDSCTTPTTTTGTITYTTSQAVDETTLSSGFKQASIGDFRLATGSALIRAGSDSTVTRDVENRPYETNDIGCYADTTARPYVTGRRPTR